MEEKNSINPECRLFPEPENDVNTNKKYESDREDSNIFKTYSQKWVFLYNDELNFKNSYDDNTFNSIEEINEKVRYEYENFPISELDEYRYFKSTFDKLKEMNLFVDFVKEKLSNHSGKLEELKLILKYHMQDSKTVYFKDVKKINPEKQIAHKNMGIAHGKTETKPRKIVTVKKRDKPLKTTVTATPEVYSDLDKKDALSQLKQERLMKNNQMNDLDL